LLFTPSCVISHSVLSKKKQPENFQAKLLLRY
jgi:hypothetical protein